jgi:uncharacterized membrane protein YukC
LLQLLTLLLLKGRYTHIERHYYSQQRHFAVFAIILALLMLIYWRHFSYYYSRHYWA